MSKELEQKLIKFEGGELLGVKSDNGKIYLGLKKTCLDLGFSERQAKYQIKEIQENEILNEGVQNFVLVQNEGGREVNREVIGIEEKFVTAWLMQIRLTPTFKKENPQVHSKLKNYQLKAVDVLHNAFMATEEQKQEFYSEMGLQGEIIELNQKLDNTIIKLNSLIDSSTINSRQSQKLLTSARERVSTILGGSHSELYKKESRMYFSNLWNSFGKYFETSSYKDLNPVHFSDGFTFISHWSMT